MPTVGWADKENMVYIYSDGILVSHKKKEERKILSIEAEWMGPGNIMVSENKPDSKRQIVHILSHAKELK